MLREIPAPTPAAGQVLVDVKASRSTSWRYSFAAACYPQMPDLPWIPGTEIAGATEDGRRVARDPRVVRGGYAELAVLDETWLFDLPDGASFEEGAAFLLAYLTAWIPLDAPGRRFIRAHVCSCTRPPVAWQRGGRRGA